MRALSGIELWAAPNAAKSLENAPPEAVKLVFWVWAGLAAVVIVFALVKRSRKP